MSKELFISLLITFISGVFLFGGWYTVNVLKPLWDEEALKREEEDRLGLDEFENELRA